MDMSGVIWQTSTYSQGGGAECIEVGRRAPGVVPIRDSKNRPGGTHLVQRATFAKFIGAVKRGEFA